MFSCNRTIQTPFIFTKKLWKPVLSIFQFPWETLVDDTDSHRHSSGTLWLWRVFGLTSYPKESCEVRVMRSGKQCRLMKSVQPSVLNKPATHLWGSTDVQLVWVTSCQLLVASLPALAALGSPGSRLRHSQLQTASSSHLNLLLKMYRSSASTKSDAAVITWILHIPSEMNFLWNVQQQLLKCAQDHYWLDFSIFCFKCWNSCFERNISCLFSSYSET